MVLALYNVLHKFLAYTVYHWANRGTERSTISTASSFNHNYVNSKFLLSTVYVLVTARFHEVSSTCSETTYLVFASLCTLLLKNHPQNYGYTST